MRLINVDTLKLQSFGHGDTPEYIILSHTWDQDEITLQDWQAVEAFPELEALRAQVGTDTYSILQERRVHDIRTKQGYIKLTRLCDTVRNRRPDCKWVWADTCCIDKTSSAELSETINSMFQWYKNSSECWVYVSDVSGRGNDLNAALEGSRWFTRGWTLQELMAPCYTYFFTGTWSCIGGLRDRGLRDRVSTITGIPESLLRPSNNTIGRLLATSVSMRMSWASRRQTSVPEDIAYCLLGLFDVNMPLLYGEGGERAFTRLQEEIIKKSTDPTIFAWGYGMPLRAEHTGLPFHRLLAPSPDYFTHGASLMKEYFNLQFPEFQPGTDSYWQFANRGLHISLSFHSALHAVDRDSPHSSGPQPYIALLECRDSFRFKYQLGFHVEVNHKKYIDSDGNPEHDASISKLQTSRPFLVSESVLDKLPKTFSRRVWVPRFVHRYSIPARVLMVNPSGFHFHLLLGSEGDSRWHWDLMEVLPPPKYIDFSTGKVSADTTRNVHINLKIWPSGRSDTSSQASLTVLRIVGQEDFTLVVHTTSHDGQTRTCQLALLRPSKDNYGEQCPPMDEFAAILAGDINPALQDITGRDGLSVEAAKLSLPDGRLSALATWSVPRMPDPGLRSLGVSYELRLVVTDFQPLFDGDD